MGDMWFPSTHKSFQEWGTGRGRPLINHFRVGDRWAMSIHKSFQELGTGRGCPLINNFWLHTAKVFRQIKIEICTVPKHYGETHQKNRDKHLPKIHKVPYLLSAAIPKGTANNVCIEIGPVDGVSVTVILHTNGTGHLGKGDDYVCQLCGVQGQSTHILLGGKQQEWADLCQVLIFNHIYCWQLKRGNN